MADPSYSFKVRTYCATFNHENYILDALKGFAMQQTSFPVVYTIVDDASTDGTAAVIKKFISENFSLDADSVGYEKDLDYGHVTFAQHKTNKNCYFAVVYLKENHYSQKKPKAPYLSEWMDTKYIALCEGDDYWTDPLKLQKQVDFLEAHEDFSMCFHEVEILCDDESEKGLFSRLREGEYTARDIYDNWIVPTCSVLYRNGKPFETNPAIVYGDIFLYLQLAERGKLYCLGFVGAVYRRHSGSLSCGYSTATCVKLYHQYKFFEKRFPAYKDISRRKQELAGLIGVIYADYFPGIWKYRFAYMFRHPKLFFSSFLTTTLLSYTPLKNYKLWKKKRQ